MVYTQQLVNGRPVVVDLEPGTGLPVPVAPAVPPGGGPPLDYPPGLGPTIGLVQGMTDGSEVVRPLAQFNNPQGFVDDAAIVNDALARTNCVRLVPGGQYTGLTTVNLGPGQWIICPALPAGQAGATVWNFAGSGDAFRQTWTGAYSGLTTVGGGILGLTVDGASHAAGASAGLHAGDIESLRYDMFVRNFAGAGDVGYHFDNTRTQTERLSGELRAGNCSTHYLFDVNGGTGSFARPNVLLFCNSGNGAQNGVVLNANANVYDADRFSISGNFSGTNGTGGAVLSLGGTARITSSRFNIGVETNSAAVVQTINFGGATNPIVDTQGVIDFSQGGGTFKASNLVTAAATFRHSGPVPLGDSTLVTTDSSGTRAQGALGNGGTIFTTLGGTVSVSPAAAITGVIIAAGQRDGQLLWVENLSGNLITFAAAGSNVAAGNGATVPAFGLRPFKWNAAQALWIGGV